MNEIMNEKEMGMELNVQELLLSYLRRWKLIALCVFLGIVIAFGITVFAITPTYRASATIYVNNNRVTGDKDYLTSSDLAASKHLVKGYMILAKSDIVLEKTAAKLEDQYSTSQLHGVISTEQIDSTVIFAIYVVHANPEEAARIANALAEIVSAEGSNVIEGTSARMIDTAKVPTAIYSPSYSTNILLGAVIGLLLAVVFVTIMFLKDTRIKDENDLTDMFDLPILGRIPDLDGEFVGTRYSYTADND